MRITKENSMMPAKVDVWFWPLDADAAVIEEMFGLLSSEQRLRANRFATPSLRGRWIVAHGRMRQILGEVTGRPPSSIRFGQEERGRPFFMGTETNLPSFNLSHSGHLGALAVSFDARIGVDVEAVRQLADDEMEWVLSITERRALNKLDSDARVKAFFRLWTLKEAYTKAIGTGVGAALPSFCFIPEGGGCAHLCAGAENAPHEQALWRFAETTPISGFRCAVAAITDRRDMQIAWRGIC
jgi:4'-phosphopantetheinyl transferase